MHDPDPGAPVDTQPMDPVALTLAVWLGLIATVTGLVRMTENASRQAAFAQYAQSQKTAALPAEDFRAMQLRMVAFGN